MTLLEILILVLLLIWVSGAFIYPIGSVIHIVLILIVVLIVVRLLQGQQIL